MEEKKDLTLEYIRYSRSEQDLAIYCKENNLDYLEFVDVVNKWNEHYGIPLVEKCMHRLEWAGKWAEHNKYEPSTAQKMFGELVIEPDVRKCRSHKKYPTNPKIHVDLGKSSRTTPVRDASIMFPSGVELTIRETNLESLIKAIVLYEEYDFRINS